MIEKQNPYRSTKYLDWVRSQPSVLSGAGPCQAHHVKGHGLGGSVKVSDLLAIPLTIVEHTEFHAKGWQTWERETGLCQLHEVMILLGRAEREKAAPQKQIDLARMQCYRHAC